MESSRVAFLVIFSIVGLVIDGWRGWMWCVTLGPFGALIALIRKHNRIHKQHLMEEEYQRLSALDEHPAIDVRKPGRIR